MKTLNIERCLDCPFYREINSDGPNYCNNVEKFFAFEFNESKGFPDWCPLPDASNKPLKSENHKNTAAD